MSKEKNKGHKEKKKPKAAKVGNKPSDLQKPANTVGGAIERDHHKHDH
ncbi:hypothetical protein [Saccharospirillum alexandrii]